MKKKVIRQTLWSLPFVALDGSFKSQTCQMNGFNVIRYEYDSYCIYLIVDIEFWFSSLTQLHNFVCNYRPSHTEKFWRLKKLPFYHLDTALQVAKSHGKLWTMC